MGACCCRGNEVTETTPLLSNDNISTNEESKNELLCNEWKSFDEIKPYFIISFLHYLTGTYNMNITDQVVRICINFAENDLNLFGLRYTMMQQLETQKYPLCTTSQRSYYIDDDNIRVFDTLKLDKKMIGKCKNMRIIVMNDVYINDRIQFDAKYYGGSIYISCRNLVINDMASILTLSKQYGTDKGYTKLLLNTDKSAELRRKYEDGNIFINVENDIQLIDRACIQSGHITIYCGNNLEMSDRARITSYGNDINIQIGGDFKMINRGYITSHNASIDIKTMGTFETFGKGHISADRFTSITCKEKQISRHSQIKDNVFTLL